ncbi:hypothetical protein CASFOL_019876 [Castilleja foliolosa]|uniref:Endonuclease/exonuclease/phosphatase domain-containing protein n=1 Tax=Castilleja foliolosa TaxID=1961234 RepID=A0ABD3D1Z8_9LAMI
MNLQITYWNCQGLLKPAAIRSLRFTIKNTKPDIIFLCEVKTTVTKPIENALNHFNLSNHIIIPPIGTAGGLILAWKDHVILTANVLQQNYIHSTITHPNSTVCWFLTTVYTPCHHTKKAEFWENMANISSNISEPWILIGDINSILSQAEKKGGLPFASSSHHNLANDLDSLGLIDLGFSGSPYTWTNKRSGIDNIQQRLDRGVANSEWITMFPRASILHLPQVGSDHSPIVLSTAPEPKLKTPFKFEIMWLDDFSCYDIVSDSWIKKVTGSPPFRLHTKIQNVKQDLKDWNTNHFGNCHTKTKDIQGHLSHIQLQDKTDINLNLEKSLLMELDTWLCRTETLWRQKEKDK